MELEGTTSTAGTYRRASPGQLSAPALLPGLQALLDIAVILLTGFALCAIHPGLNTAQEGPYLALMSVDAVLATQLFALLRLYDLRAIYQPRRQLQRVALACLLLFMLTTAYLFALKLSDQVSRLWTAAWIGSSAATVWFARLAASAVLERCTQAGVLTRNLVLIGTGPQAQRLIEHLRSAAEPALRVAGIFDDRGSRLAAAIPGCPLLGDVNALVGYVREHRIDEILIALPWSARERIRGIVERLRVLPVQISLCPDLAALDFLPHSYSDVGSAKALRIVAAPLSTWQYLTKLAEDRLLGGALLLLATPLMLLTAALIKLDSPGPVFFRQMRLGFNDKLIRVWKFRTMYADREDADAEQITIPGDPRVTRVGALLRRWSLDELPQLLNVIGGSMSLVGPRPHALKARAGDRLYPEVVNNYAARHRVRPGITGWAQVQGWRGETDTYEKLARRVEHDLYYIDNWSLALDLKILAKTLLVCLRGENAH